LSGLVPERDLLLAEEILDRFNHRLHCPSCNIKYTEDLTVFRRDQAGRRGSLFYRKYRCKGKGNRVSNTQCHASYGVKQFIKIATDDLGPTKIASLRVELDLPLYPPSPLPIRAPHKRRQASISPTVQVPRTPEKEKNKHSIVYFVTGYSPAYKRVNCQNVSSYPDMDTTSDSDLVHRLELTEKRLQFFEEESKKKQKTIDELLSIFYFNMSLNYRNSSYICLAKFADPYGYQTP
jgi:hypothetical protein